jgi:conjugal transfer pilus assembly protein TraW
MRSGSPVGRLLLAIALLPLVAQGQLAEDKAIRDQAKAIENWALGAERPSWLDAGTSTDPRMTAATQAAEALGRQEIQRQGEGTASPQASPQVPGPNDIAITVLASTALGEGALRDLFALAAQTPGTRVVFRGVLPGQSLMDFLRTLAPLLAELDPPPAVELDPTPFGTEKIAPVLIASGPQGEIARVEGLSDPAWLRSQVAGGQGGDLGVRGPVKPIVEPNLVDELKRRLAELDLAKLREKAIGRYWQRVSFSPLPVAGQRRERVIDPTVTANADVRDHEGNLVVAAGTRTNPLDMLPFTQRLVVFDATDPRQVTVALRMGEEAAKGRRVTYIATAFERRSGWDGFRSVEDRLDAPVYLLTPDVRARFALERVPAMVEARERVFVVTEVPPL